MAQPNAAPELIFSYRLTGTQDAATHPVNSQIQHHLKHDGYSVRSLKQTSEKGATTITVLLSKPAPASGGPPTP